MVTINKIGLQRERVNDEFILVQVSLLSTDDKPTTFDGQKVDNGSVCIEIDTGDIFLFDLENSEWKEI